MADREVYKARLQQPGVTRRDRELYYLKNRISLGIGDLLNSHEVTLRGEPITITSEITEYASIKKFTCSSDIEIGHGDYIVWDGHYWLVTERDFDDDVYIRGKITQCNYYLTWQNDSGEIIGRWAVVSQVTRYNNGVFEGKIVDNLESTLSVQLVCDSETVRLKREKRFLADVYSEEPYAYKITQRDVLSSYYGESGLVAWAVSQDVFNPETDNAELMIADYWRPSVKTEITGDQSCRIGCESSYVTSAESPLWSIRDGSFCNLQTDGKRAVISVSADRGNIGKIVYLSDGTTEIPIRIAPLY